MLTVIIVNYRTAELTIDCLQSLADEARLLACQVVVVDNASGDDSVVRLEAAVARNDWSDWVSIRPLPRNGGFAYGNNAAVRSALEQPNPPDYFLLLNPDTVVRPAAVSRLIEFIAQHPQAGIVGSRLEDPDGTPQCSAFRFPSFLGELDNGLRLGVVSKLLAKNVVAPPVSDEPCRADWVAGASMLVRRRVFEDVGLMDDRYFMYYEEVDFCRRAAALGYQCWYEPASRVVHLVGQASGVTGSQPKVKRLPAYWFESRRRYFVQHHGRAYTLLSDAAWAACYALWWLGAKLTGKPIPDPPRMWRDFLAHSSWRRGFSA